MHWWMWSLIGIGILAYLATGAILLGISDALSTTSSKPKAWKQFLCFVLWPLQYFFGIIDKQDSP
jgi:hypothetical protein